MSSFHGVSAAYERSFGQLCGGAVPTMLSALPDEPGQLLDVGCGTGDLLVQALAHSWDARGCDLDEQMLARTEERAPGRAFAGALPDLPCEDGAFDAVTANFVVNHVERPQDSVSEMARVLRPGGTLAMTIWPSGNGVIGSAWTPLLGACFEAAAASAVSGQHLRADLDFPRTPEGLASLAERADMEVSRAGICSWEWHVHPDDLWAGIEAGIGGAGVRYLHQNAAVQARIRTEYEIRCGELLNASALPKTGLQSKPQQYRTEGLLSLPSSAVLVVARKFSAHF